MSARLEWEPVTGGGMAAELPGVGTLTATRAERYSRWFAGRINGKPVGQWLGLEMAMVRTEKIAHERLRGEPGGPVTTEALVQKLGRRWFNSDRAGHWQQLSQERRQAFRAGIHATLKHLATPAEASR